MALQPGKRDKTASEPETTSPLARFAGFAACCGVGLTLLAAVVLLPAYARRAQAQYELQCHVARVADEEALIDFNQRLGAAATVDSVLIKRLAMSQFNLLPRDELVTEPDAPSPFPAGIALPTRHPRPQSPSNALMVAAAKLENPATKRGLFLIASAGLMAGMFLFQPPKSKPA